MQRLVHAVLNSCWNTSMLFSWLFTNSGTLPVSWKRSKQLERRPEPIA
jgi:hypothetical protein